MVLLLNQSAATVITLPDMNNMMSSTSTPTYSQPNGKAEKWVHSLKQVLKKAIECRSDPYVALLSYRASPIDCGLSPAELLRHHNIRTTLPFSGRDKQNTVMEKFKLAKQRQKHHYDKSVKHLKQVNKDDVVGVKDAWTRKTTVPQEVKPRSYTVKTEDGKILRQQKHSNHPQGMISGAAEPSGLASLRRSTRTIKKPERLFK
uniref:Integrase catalytic domain-containing protein n=1 Tax=Paramormyrops kingsleyae TaxID=1676925 RepID=A0A3B3TDV6_9TELE